MLRLKDAIEKAGTLIEAMNYIQKFRNRVVVIKLGGSAMEGAELTALLADVVFMEAVGMRPVLVHGGGPAISKAMKEKGKEPVYRERATRDGRRDAADCEGRAGQADQPRDRGGDPDARGAGGGDSPGQQNSSITARATHHEGRSRESPTTSDWWARWRRVKTDVHPGFYGGAGGAGDCAAGGG